MPVGTREDDTPQVDARPSTSTRPDAGESVPDPPTLPDEAIPVHRRAWRHWPLWLRITSIIVAFVAIGPVLLTLPWRWIDPPTTTFILIKGNASGDGPAGERRWVPWAEMSPHAAMAVIAAEDQKFAHHYGFDVESIRETLSAQSSRGASTITQQVAKNLFLWPGRNWVRKGLEACLTSYIEFLWPKRRILEVYVNVAEFGPGVYGVASASERYFGVPPADLSRYQSALLAAVLPNPRRMSPLRPSPYVMERALWIMDQMEQLGGASYLEQL